MASPIIEIEASEIAKETTFVFSFKGYRGWLIRLRIARFFIWLACRIAGTNLEVEE